MTTKLELRIIKENNVGKERHINNDMGKTPLFNMNDPLYDKFVTFIHNPELIRLGLNEQIRTSELASHFNKNVGETISHTVRLPKIMNRLIEEYPNLGIVKKLRSCGTVYTGLGVANENSAEQRFPTLVPKINKEKWQRSSKILLDNFKKEISDKMKLSDIQYQQMVNLNLIYIVHDNKTINIELTYLATIGRLIEYTCNKINKIKRQFF